MEGWESVTLPLSHQCKSSSVPFYLNPSLGPFPELRVLALPLSQRCYGRVQSSLLHCEVREVPGRPHCSLSLHTESSWSEEGEPELSVGEMIAVRTHSGSDRTRTQTTLSISPNWFCTLTVERLCVHCLNL